MHPNLQAVAGKLDLAPGVELHGVDEDVRALFARSRVTVTDCSSMAFNAAYIDYPLVYFQFDHDRVDGGCRERVVQAIIDGTRRVTPSERTQR